MNWKEWYETEWKRWTKADLTHDRIISKLINYQCYFNYAIAIWLFVLTVVILALWLGVLQ